MTCRHLQFTTALLVVTLALASQSTAQEQDDGDSVRSTRLGLLVPHETRREKRRAAKAGGWAWTFAGSAAAGYDSNLHLAPGNEVNSRVVGSGVFEAALRAEVLHYFNRDSRLELRAEANAVPYTETTEVNDYNQKVSAFYGQRLSENFKFLLSADISHKNDNATFINGEQLDRDFESWNYQGRPTLSYRFHSDHKLRIQYRVKYKDYVETPSLNSLDWLSHGPKVYYDWDVLDNVEIELSYAFKSQNYDEEIASLSDGTETLSNPDERHFFHDLQAGVSWEAFDWLKLNVTGGFKRKDDQYRDFESYNSFMAKTGATMALGAFMVSADIKFQHRDYDNRPNDTTGKLMFDRVDFALAGRTQLTPSIGVFAGYDLRWRDTNKNAGTSYRSYTAHQVMMGVAWAH